MPPLYRMQRLEFLEYLNALLYYFQLNKFIIRKTFLNFTAPFYGQGSPASKLKR